jgi:hypothetical protein
MIVTTNGLIFQYNPELKRLARGKRFSLFGKSVGEEGKKFYNIGVSTSRRRR